MWCAAFGCAPPSMAGRPKRNIGKSSAPRWSGDDRLAARQQVAERLAEFRRRTGGRGAGPVVELLAEARAERLRSLTGDEQGRGEGA